MLEPPRGQRDRSGALQHVGEKRRGGKPLAASAQHVGCADAAGADGADILRAGESREDQTERDRAEQVAERKRCNVMGVVHHAEAYSNTVRPATMVRSTRPCSRASSNGVFLHFDFSSAGSSTHGASISTTITSAGLPGLSVPYCSPSN